MWLERRLQERVWQIKKRAPLIHLLNVPKMLTQKYSPNKIKGRMVDHVAAIRDLPLAVNQSLLQWCSSAKHVAGTQKANMTESDGNNFRQILQNNLTY